MNRAGTTGARLIATFALGAILLNYPILSIFSRPADVAGVPLLYAYIFVVWTMVIGLMALVVERPPD